MAQDLGSGVRLHCGDCLKELDKLKRDSIDSCITDPPYHLTSIVKRFGSENAAPVRVRQYKTGAYGGGFTESSGGTGAAFARMSRGFMGKQWDGGDIAFQPAVWRRVYRVLKPGAYLLAFGGSRTFHRMACAIEDAGFEIRDTIMWVYGEGFPKSLDISKQIDKIKGAKRNRVPVTGALHKSAGSNIQYGHVVEGQQLSNDAITPEAKQWNGWGTALKPALEPVIVARKPISEKNVTANVLRWGTGALNIEASRIGLSGGIGKVINQLDGLRSDAGWGYRKAELDDTVRGRWPSNLIHDGSEEVAKAFPNTVPSSGRPRNNSEFKSVAKGRDTPHVTHGHDDVGGSAARFYGAFPFEAGEQERNQRLFQQQRGRWPSNLLHDGSDEVERAFPRSQSQSGILTSVPGHVYGGGKGLPSNTQLHGYDEAEGSNARFYAAFPFEVGEQERNQRLFYSPKADHDDRRGSKHPTVKPIALLKYLIRLVTPPGGLVLDPFAGTGTLGEAAAQLGYRSVLIEREREYQQDIRRRMATMRGFDRGLARDAAKTKGASEFGSIWE